MYILPLSNVSVTRWLFTVDDYQELTPREEKDLDKMLAQFEHALGNVEEFTGQLSKELQQLEYVSYVFKITCLY